MLVCFDFQIISSIFVISQFVQWLDQVCVQLFQRCKLLAFNDSIVLMLDLEQIKSTCNRLAPYTTMFIFSRQFLCYVVFSFALDRWHIVLMILTYLIAQASLLSQIGLVGRFWYWDNWEGLWLTVLYCFSQDRLERVRNALHVGSIGFVTYGAYRLFKVLLLGWGNGMAWVV